MAEYLYPLTLSLVPCDPIDRTGVYYFNYCHPTITHPLKKDLSIKSYHEKIFSSPSFILTPPKFDHNHETLIFFHPFSHTLYSSVIDMHRETHTVRPSTVQTSAFAAYPRHNPPHDLRKIINPERTLFFIQYISEGSIRPRWFLVRIELELVHSLDLQPNTTCNYLVAFLARHCPNSHQINTSGHFYCYY